MHCFHENVIENKRCPGSQPNFTSFPAQMPSWTIHSLFCLESKYCDLLDSEVLHQQSCILHFHAVCISPAHCVPDSKLYKQTSRFPKTKKFRAVSGIFFHPRYHGIADRRCFISISRNLPLLFHSCERIIFFSDFFFKWLCLSVSGMLLWQWHIAI